MFKVKYTYENIEFYNCSGIATRLEEMASKGWMIEKLPESFINTKKYSHSG